MKRILFLCMLLVLLIAGCGSDEQPKTASRNNPSPGETLSAGHEEKRAASDQTAVNSGGVGVTIRPEHPVAVDCLEASVMGLRDKVFVWTVNGHNVQQSMSNRYCLEGAVRDDVVTVTVGDTASGGSASVTIGNSLPRVLDTSLKFVAEGGNYFVEITPEVEDADKDYVSLSYQWLINDQVNEAYAENRLPSDAYQTGDTLQVRITPEDGYGKGPTYTSRKLDMLNAAPVITSQPPKSFEALEYNYQVEATDVDSSDLAFSLEGAPDGMTIDAQTGMIIWPLADVSPGKYQVKIVVTDPDGSTGGQEFILNLDKHKISRQE